MGADAPAPSQPASTPARFRVPERITFANLGAQRAAGEAFVREAGGGPVVFDLTDADGSASPGAALMTAWFRACRLLGVPVAFVELPRELRNIVEVTGLDHVLPIDGEPR